MPPMFPIAALSKRYSLDGCVILAPGYDPIYISSFWENEDTERETRTVEMVAGKDKYTAVVDWLVLHSNSKKNSMVSVSEYFGFPLNYGERMADVALSEETVLFLRNDAKR